MKLLYTTSCCEVLPGIGKVLLPGSPVTDNMIRVQKGDTIHIKLADGSCLKTLAEKQQIVDLDTSESSQAQVKSGLYAAVVVSDEFSAKGLEQGAEVYVEDKT